MMALPEATVGLLPCGGGTQNLAWLVGEGWAKRMILCGERVNADRTPSIGLVEEVVEKGAALDQALHLAESAAAAESAGGHGVQSRSSNARAQGDIASAYAAERESFVKLFDTLDQTEGVTAFLEKRKPVWKNADGEFAAERADRRRRARRTSYGIGTYAGAGDVERRKDAQLVVACR